MSSVKAKKEPILDLKKYTDKRIVISCLGGRTISGILKGCDGLQNVVLDECEGLGLVVVRGPVIMNLSPEDGRVKIDNPFK